MGALGSIYDDDDTPRAGRDLQASVPFPRARLGAPATVEIPLTLPLGDERVSRAIGPGESGSTVTLNLPTSLPDGAVLRLRGMGEWVEDGKPGDLYLTIQLTDATPPTRPVGGWLVAPLIVGAGVLFWFLAR